MPLSRKAYPTDVSDEEWAFCAPYLCLMSEDAPQREYSLREVFNALRWMARAGCPWRLLPIHFPPWQTVYQQVVRWMKAECFERMCHDLREAPHRICIAGMAIRMIRLGGFAVGVFKALGIVVRTGAEHIVKRFHERLHS